MVGLISTLPAPSAHTQITSPLGLCMNEVQTSHGVLTAPKGYG